MKPLIRSTFLLLGAASMASAATTKLLNVDFGSNGQKTGAAVLGTTGDIWNSIGTTGSNATLSGNLNWADGTGSSGVTLTQISGTYSGTFDANGGDAMMRDYLSLYSGGNNGPITFRLSGFTPNSTLASIVFYGTGDVVGQNSSFTVGTVAGTVTETDTAATNNTAVPTSLTPEGNVYVSIENVLVNNLGQVDFTWTNPANGSQFAAFNGMQVFVPEPSAALLGGIGMLALLRRRRA